MVLAHFFLHQNANGSAGFSKQIESYVYILKRLKITSDVTVTPLK